MSTLVLRSTLQAALELFLSAAHLSRGYPELPVLPSISLTLHAYAHPSSFCHMGSMTNRSVWLKKTTDVFQPSDVHACMCVCVKADSNSSKSRYMSKADDVWKEVLEHHIMRSQALLLLLLF